MSILSSYYTVARSWTPCTVLEAQLSFLHRHDRVSCTMHETPTITACSSSSFPPLPYVSFTGRRRSDFGHEYRK